MASSAPQQSGQPSTSRTQTQNQPSSQTQTEVRQIRPRSETPAVLRLRGAHPPTARSVQWREDVVDNEGLGRKKSKGTGSRWVSRLAPSFSTTMRPCAAANPCLQCAAFIIDPKVSTSPVTSHPPIRALPTPIPMPATTARGRRENQVHRIGSTRMTVRTTITANITIGPRGRRGAIAVASDVLARTRMRKFQSLSRRVTPVLETQLAPKYIKWPFKSTTSHPWLSRFVGRPVWERVLIVSNLPWARSLAR